MLGHHGVLALPLAKLHERNPIPGHKCFQRRLRNSGSSNSSRPPMAVTGHDARERTGRFRAGGSDCWN